MKKTACVVFCTDERYAELMTNVRNSFLEFNGDECDFFQIDQTNQKEYNDSLQYFEFAPETFLMQYIYAFEIMKKHNYQKVIILGTDTIVCRKDETRTHDLLTPSQVR